MKGRLEMNTREQFLNFQLKLIGQMLGYVFKGVTLHEKEAFYDQHKQQLQEATNTMFTEMHAARTATVILFGDGKTESDWVVAESKEQAFEYYQKVAMMTDVDIERTEYKVLDTTTDFMLYAIDEIPLVEQKIFKESEHYKGHLEVPFVYAISYALQNGMKLPDIIQSFE